MRPGQIDEADLRKHPHLAAAVERALAGQAGANAQKPAPPQPAASPPAPAEPISVAPPAAPPPSAPALGPRSASRSQAATAPPRPWAVPAVACVVALLAVAVALGTWWGARDALRSAEAERSRTVQRSTQGSATVAAPVPQPAKPTPATQATSPAPTPAPAPQLQAPDPPTAPPPPVQQLSPQAPAPSQAPQPSTIPPQVVPPGQQILLTMTDRATPDTPYQCSGMDEHGFPRTIGWTTSETACATFRTDYGLSPPQANCPAPLSGRITSAWSGRRIAFPVGVLGPSRWGTREAVLDTGAALTVFPDAWLRELGFQPVGSASVAGVGAGPSQAFAYDIPYPTIGRLTGGWVNLGPGTLRVYGVPGFDMILLGPQLMQESRLALATSGDHWTITFPCR